MQEGTTQHVDLKNRPQDADTRPRKPGLQLEALSVAEREAKRELFKIEVLKTATNSLVQAVRLKYAGVDRAQLIEMLATTGRFSTSMFLDVWTRTHNRLSYVNVVKAVRRLFSNPRAATIDIDLNDLQDIDATMVQEVITDSSIFQKINFEEIIGKFWTRRSGKVEFTGSWPKQSDATVFDRAFLKSVTTFTNTISVDAESNHPEDITLEKVSDINPFQLFAALSRAAIQKISVERVEKKNKAIERGQGDKSGDGVSFVTMPVLESVDQANDIQSELRSRATDPDYAPQEIAPIEENADAAYFVVIHYGNFFKKVAIDASALMSDGTNDRVYLLFERAFDFSQGPSLTDNGWMLFPTTEARKLNKKKDLLVQETYQDRANPKAFWAADLGIVVTDFAHVDSADEAQRDLRRSTYGPSIPSVVTVGLEKNAGKVAFKGAQVNISHFWSDGRIGHDDITGVSEKNLDGSISTIDGYLYQSLQECSTNPVPTRPEQVVPEFWDAGYQKTADIVDNLDFSPPIEVPLSDEEAPVLEFQYQKQHERLADIEATFGQYAQEEDDALFALSQMNAHSFFTLAMMAAAGVSDAQFLDVDKKSGGLAPSIAILPPPVFEALLNDEPFSAEQTQLLLRALAFFGRQRQRSSQGLGDVQVIASVAGGVASKLKESMVSRLGKLVDRDRTAIVADSPMLISTLFAKKNVGFVQKGLRNKWFTSARSSTHQHNSVGAIQVDEQHISVTVRRGKISDCPYTSQEVQARFEKIYNKLLSFAENQKITPHIAEDDESW